MKLRRKHRLIILSWFVLGSILMLLGMYVSQWFLLILIIYMCIIALLGRNLRCPKCGKIILYNEVTVFGMKFKIWTSWMPSKCPNCGELLE